MAVVVPVRDEPRLDECLAALAGGTRRPDELVVVDDGSDPPVAADVTVLRLEPGRGPAAARNLGAGSTNAEILVFVDGDVAVCDDTLARLAERLSDPAVDAVQALYTADVDAPDFATDFQNLYQHYNFASVAHADRLGGLSSYCVAIRRADFEAAGGFDEAIDRPTVEDDNLGHTLFAAGKRIVMAPEVQVRHMARFSVVDLLRRMHRMARDKIRSIRRRPARAAVSPARTHHRPGFLAAVAAAPLVLGLLPLFPPAAAAVLLGALVANGRFLRFVASRRGPLFALKAFVMLMGLASAAAVGCVHGLMSPGSLANRLVPAAVLIGLVLAVWHGEQPPDSPAPPSGAVALVRVSNASGLALVERDGELLVATVDEVDEWEGPGDPPPLVTLSRPSDGVMVGGEGAAGAHGEVEALAVRDGRFAFPWKPHGQRVSIRDGDRDIEVVDEHVIRRLAGAMGSDGWWFEFEGLDYHDGGWELVATAVERHARNAPASTAANFRLRTGADGTFERLSPAIHHPDGRRYTDYAASLDVLPDGRALIGGFFEGGAVIVDPQGKIERRIELDTRRVEGIAWHQPTRRLFLVRECPGTGVDCASGNPFGTPLWVVDLPDGL